MLTIECYAAVTVLHSEEVGDRSEPNYGLDVCQMQRVRQRKCVCMHLLIYKVGDV